MDLPDWVQRSERAHLNMLENLPVSAAIVLIVHSSGAANVTTALGAQIFFLGTCCHGRWAYGRNSRAALGLLVCEPGWPRHHSAPDFLGDGRQ